MIKIKLIQIIIAVLFLINLTTSYVKCEEFHKDKIIIKKQLDGGNVLSLFIKRSNKSSSYPYKKPLMWGGDNFYYPSVVISEIVLIVGKEEILLPFSAYSDLGNPREVTLEIKEKQLIINILGGETACSYSATLIFENGDIVRRKVCNGELPEEVWEETVYSFKKDE